MLTIPQMDEFSVLKYGKGLLRLCLPTVKPLITNTSEEFIKCRRQFSNEFYTLLRNFQ